MKKVNMLLLTCSLILLVIILYTWPVKTKEKFNSDISMAVNTPFNSCYDTQMACMNDCAPVYTFTPNTTNKWIFANGGVDNSLPPTLFFTRYPNNVVEVSSSAVNTISNCKGDGWLYMSLTDGVWKEQQRTIPAPPEFISSLVYNSPSTNVQPFSTIRDLKTSGEFPIIIFHNTKEIAIAGIGKFTGENLPSLFLYIIPNGKSWFNHGGGTSMAIPPFVGRYQSGA